MKQDELTNCRFRNARGAAGGFSLIELLIGSVVFVIVLLAIYMILDTSQRDYASGAAKSDVQENVRVALESMARELRLAGYAPSKTGCASPPSGAVTGLSPLTFWADVDGDSCVDQVIYSFVPPANLTKPCDPSDSTTVGRITRSVQGWNGTAWNPATPTAYDIAQCITALTITYLTTAGNPTGSATPYIRISITGRENARGSAARIYLLTTDVRLRNS